MALKKLDNPFKREFVLTEDLPKLSKEEGFALVNSYIDRLDNKNSQNPCFHLGHVYNIHQEMWADGIRHHTFGPDLHGMFRCSDIMSMTRDQVYLGNINGIWRNTLNFFQNGFDKGEIDTETYYAVFNQYKNHLKSNLIHIRNQFYDCGLNVDKLSLFLQEKINEKVSSTFPYHVGVKVSHGIEPGGLKDIELSYHGNRVKSSLLILLEDGKTKVYMPSAGKWGKESGYLPPHIKERSDIVKYNWTEVFEGCIYRIEPTLFKNKYKVFPGTDKLYEPRKTDSIRHQKEESRKKYKNFLKR